MTTTRHIILDTETTGISPKKGHRIIEIGCIEMVNRQTTKEIFHCYLNPERDVDQGAVEVHGLTNEFLADKGFFKDVVKDFLSFVQGADLVIHNAPFDIGFLDAELQRLGPQFGRMKDYCTVTDTLAIARKKHPGQPNSLDALCRRYHVENSHRELHGALLDSELLAQVYLHLTGGQGNLSFAASEKKQADIQAQAKKATQYGIPVIFPNAEELSQHNKHMQGIKSPDSSLWPEWKDA